jgi:hemolysin-activating ACP:hemolysin acyltransferase
MTAEHDIPADALNGEAPPVNAQTQPAPTMTPEQQQQAALASKMMMAAYGEIVSILARAPQYKTSTLSDLDWLVVPAVMSGQFSLAEAQMKGSGLVAPIGLVMWARVSADVDRRLTENIASPVRLQPAEWKSGDILWLIDALGEPRIIEAMLKRLVQTEWKGRDARMRARTKDGTFKVGLISDPKAAPAATS